MSVSPVLGLSLMLPGQGGKYHTFNEALHQIEGLLVRVSSRSTVAEPAGVEGAAYILPAGKTGANWGARTAGEVAVFYGGAWTFRTPVEGVRVWCVDEDLEVIYNGAGWQRRGGALVVNVSADADLTLSVDANGADLVEVTDSGVLLTAGRSVVCDGRRRILALRNSTAQILTLKTAAGAGVAVAAGASAITWCDGTDVRRLTADV